MCAGRPLFFWWLLPGGRCGGTANLCYFVWGFGWRSVLFLDFFLGVSLMEGMGNEGGEEDARRVRDGRRRSVERGMTEEYLVGEEVSTVSNCSALS